MDIAHGLAACDLALVASGTATLEAALFKRPMVISFAVNWLSYRIMKPKQLQPWLGLPNILCGDFVVPELMQHDAKPEALAAALLEWLASSPEWRPYKRNSERCTTLATRHRATGDRCHPKVLES
jgi:lipid-A-disaccharide synthase